MTSALIPAAPHALASLEPEARSLIMAQAKALKLTAGATVFASGTPCHHYLVVRSGSIKVSVTAEGGRQIVLYRVGPGEVCVLTTACLMGGNDYSADAIAETAIDAVLLPKPLFDELMATSQEFRTFVFRSFGGRLHGLIALVQDVVERHVDRRLARHLAAGPDRLDTTHQQLATELGTVREVVSRLLKDFEDRGWITMKRGRIAIMSRNNLADYAGAM
jgi:CRP/FNR family transcriptional regulator, anaerobic regulatory protein